MERKTEVTTTKTNGTLSYSSTIASIPLEPVSLRGRIDYMADAYPDRVALVFDMNNGLQLTYSNIRERCYLLANNLVSLGLQRGDRIAYLLPNTHELVVSYFAASIAGLISVPLDADYGSDELDYMLKKTSPTALVLYDCGDYQKLISDLLPEINSGDLQTFKSAKFPHLRHVIVVDDHSNQVKTNYKLTHSFNELSTKLIDSSPKQFPYVDPDDIFAILFTSGTTSRPKGVESRYFSLLNNIKIQSEIVGKSDLDNDNEQVVICITTLIYHVSAIFSLMLTMVSPDYRIVFPSYKFDLVEIMRSVQRHKCTTLSCLPKILSNLIDHPRRAEFDLSSLHGAVCGGQMINADLITRVRDELGLKYFGIAYGMTEVNLISYKYIQFGSSAETEAFSGCVGNPFPFVECKIVDPETGNIQPLNTEGELHVRGYNITRGFWNDEDMTKKLIDKNGWLNTGDILSMDKDGFLYFKSRSKEIITVKGSGRLDVYPSIVESVLLKHPNISEAIVFGVGVNAYEQELCAWVKLKSNEVDTSEKEIIKHCEQMLVDYQVPRFIKFVSDFPANRIGKYVRNEMSRRFKEELKI